jgi:hypothetical protein
MRIRNHERVIEPDNPSEIDLMPHTEAFTDFPQFRTGGRTETAHQPITAEPPSIRHYQLRPLQPSRSKIPVSSAEIEAFPWRMSRPVWKSPRSVKNGVPRTLDGVPGTPA